MDLQQARHHRRSISRLKQRLICSGKSKAGRRGKYKSRIARHRQRDAVDTGGGAEDHQIRKRATLCRLHTEHSCTSTEHRHM